MGVAVRCVALWPAHPSIACQRAGLRVRRVARNSPAARAGLRRNDILLNVNGFETSFDGALRLALMGRQHGDPVCVSVLRADDVIDFVVRVRSFAPA